MYWFEHNYVYTTIKYIVLNREPSSFLRQHLAPNTSICDVHDKGDLRRDYIFNSTLAHRFWL